MVGPRIDNAHELSADGVLEELHTDVLSGLTSTEVRSRRAAQGENTLPIPPERSVLVILRRLP